jgi:hypothetical protein
MGACDFTNYVENTDVSKAFDIAHENAQHEHGHGGYSGSIAEKDGYTVLSREPLAGEELQAFINAHMQDNDKWGPAFAVPMAKTTKGATTTKTVTLRAKSEDGVRRLAIEKVKKSRKGQVKVRVLKTEKKGSTNSLKITKKRLLKKTPKVRFRACNTLFKTLPEAMKEAEKAAKEAVAAGKDLYRYDYDVTPVLVADADDTKPIGHGASAGRVSIGRDDQLASFKVTLEVTPVKVERTISGWCFFGYASE